MVLVHDLGTCVTLAHALSPQQGAEMGAWPFPVALLTVPHCWRVTRVGVPPSLNVCTWLSDSRSSILLALPMYRRLLFASMLCSLLEGGTGPAWATPWIEIAVQWAGLEEIDTRTIMGEGGGLIPLKDSSQDCSYHGHSPKEGPSWGPTGINSFLKIVEAWL